MSLNPCAHRPNGLGALDEYGRMVCGQCGHPYDQAKGIVEQVAARRQDTEFVERITRQTSRDRGVLARLRSVETQVRELPMGLFVGANRYDTDDTHVLHLWTGAGESYDVRWPK